MEFLSPILLIALTGALALLVAAVWRMRVRFRKQAEELRALSILSQILRANLNLNALLNMVYLQTGQLLDMDNFLVALYDRDTGQLHYPLFIKQGKQEIPPIYNSGRTLIDHLLEKREPLLISRDVGAQAQRMGRIPPEEAVLSWLGVPLLSGERTLGALAVSSQQRHFGPDDLRLLNIVAANTSVAIDNAQFYEEQIERVRQMATLNNILSLLTGTFSSDDLLDMVISSASVVADATAVAVYMLWDETTMALARYAGLSDAFANDAPDPLVVTHPDLEMLHQGKPIIVNDVQQDKRVAHLRQVMAREGKAAWIELPLTIGGIHAGVLVAYFDKPYPFSEEKIELLRTFANQVAQAMNNARLYRLTDEMLQRRVGQLLTLANVGHDLIAITELSVIGNVILKNALDSTAACRGVIALRDENSQPMRVVSQTGFSADALARPDFFVEGTMWRALQTGETARDDYESGQPRAQLSVPIQRGKDTLGVITLESDEPHGFSEDDSHFIIQLANQMVIAIDNARLFHDVSSARDRLQVILDNMDEAIVLISPSGEIALANPRVDLLGFRAEQLIGQRVSDLLNRSDARFAERIGFSTIADAGELAEALRATVFQEGREPVAYALSGYRGTVHVQRQIIPVRDGEAVSMLLVFRDQTEQRELELMREDLSQMIVHDLRSPLTAVNTGLKLLRDVIPFDSSFRPAVENTTETTQRAIRKLLSRVDSLLDIAKLESGRQLTLEIGPAELSGLVDNVFAELRPLAHELEVNLVSEVAHTLLQVDAEKIERVLLNLVDNALKFSPAASRVTVSAYAPGTHDAASGFARIEVLDEGPGVPDEHKLRLFDRFEQIEGRQGKRRGTGLGLAFCRLVIQAHGGRIWIEDKPGGGSVFAFTLPVVRETT